jgi:Glycosyl transferase family 2
MPETIDDEQVRAAAWRAGLEVALESPLPSSLPVGRATAIFCAGTCSHRRQSVVDLRILVDGAAHRPPATRMPRPDLAGTGEAAARYRSGFWLTVPVPAHDAPGAVVLQAAVRLGDGTSHLVPLGRIEVTDRAIPALGARPEQAGEGLIAICLATHEPDPELLAIQIESLRAQTDRRWVCLISDDCSGPEASGRIADAVGDDPRFAVSRSPRRLGFYRNFERALSMVPPEAELVALCDQDDRWYPDKLATLRGALGDATLVYCDQRLVDRRGRVLRDTMWQGRRNNHTDLASLLVANTITGAATLFRRSVAELALPFPDSPGLQFHDHWIGLVALAAGEVAYVDRPLYDYVQHGGAVFGDVTGDGGTPTRRTRRRGWRAAYFCGYQSRVVQAETLLVRCAATLTPRKRRVLARFPACERSPLWLAWLAVRPLRTLVGRTETLGSEAGLARGVLWRWLILPWTRAAALLGRASGDATFPDPLDFEQTRLRRWRARA